MKKQIGAQLIKELEKGYNIERIADWAYNLLYIDSKEDNSPEIDSLLRELSVMEAGPEFEYTQEELKIIAHKLIFEVREFELLESFTDERLGWQLNYELARGYDIVKISTWAERVLFKTRHLTPMQDEVLTYLSLMQSDPQFEFTAEEIKWLADSLENGEKDPMKKLIEMVRANHD